MGFCGGLFGDVQVVCYQAEVFIKLFHVFNRCFVLFLYCILDFLWGFQTNCHVQVLLFLVRRCFQTAFFQ